MAVDWWGDKVKARMLRAAMVGINQTMAEAVGHAKQNHSFQNRTTTLEKGIRIGTSATPRGSGAFGIWGVFNVLYAQFIEFGTAAHVITVKASSVLANKKTGQFFGKRVNHPGNKPMPFLRPAADAIYPRLASKIKAAFARG